MTTTPRTAWKMPPIEDLRALRKAKMTLLDIAGHYGVSRGLVKRWCEQNKIFAETDYRKVSKPEERKRQRRPISDEEGLDPDDGLTLTDRAGKILGSRMGEDRRRGSYLLDGRPVSVEAILLAAGLALPEQRA